MRAGERVVVYGLLGLALVGASRGLPGVGAKATGQAATHTVSLADDSDSKFSRTYELPADDLTQPRIQDLLHRIPEEPIRKDLIRKYRIEVEKTREDLFREPRLALAGFADATGSTIATCDIYLLIERMVESSDYAPARASEEARINAIVQPLQTELRNLQNELQNATSRDAATEAKIRAFEEKRETYAKRHEELSTAYTKMVSQQFIDAYTRIIAETRKVADERGFAYVFAQESGPLTPADPQRLMQDFLARPLAVSPTDADLTETVRTNLKLSAAPAMPSMPGNAPDALGVPGSPSAPAAPGVPAMPK